MSLTPRIVPVLALLALAACQAATGAPPAGPAAPAPVGDMPRPVLPNPADDTCGASGLAMMIGQQGSAIDPARFGGPVRVIRPGEAVTMDFNPQRLNFELDDLGEITRVSCG